MTENAGFLEQMDRQLAGWQDPARRLVEALERDELVLYAQPVFAFHGAERFPIAEVLVRLREEERALLPPGEFFPVFEHYGMMPQLDCWVTRKVVARLARGSRVPRLSVNVSAQTLNAAEFALFVAAELERARVPPASLIFEVDENDALVSPGPAEQFAASVRATGCQILLDGFGRRSVTFAPLTSLRAAYVKVDGVIVRKLPSSEVARSKLRAIARVGEVIGAAVIGECVEDQDVLDQLRACGAGYAQGFGLCRPMPLDSIAEQAI
jgi:EAL domain-containing protein (putative c-di-GMP-specific phosphodiesterase class I)